MGEIWLEYGEIWIETGEIWVGYGWNLGETWLEHGMGPGGIWVKYEWKNWYILTLYFDIVKNQDNFDQIGLDWNGMDENGMEWMESEMNMFVLSYGMMISGKYG